MTVNFEIQLNGARYPVACSEAEAPRVKQLAEQLGSRIANLHKDLGHAQVSDAHLLALMSLMLMDEVADLSGEAQRAKTEAAKPAAAPAPAPAPVKAEKSEDEELFVHAVTHLTERVNLIAQKLRAA